MHPAADFPCAQPVTDTSPTVPSDRNVTTARETSSGSAAATQDLAFGSTAPTALCSAPCDGCSGTFPRAVGTGSAAAVCLPSSAFKPVASDIAPASPPALEGAA